MAFLRTKRINGCPYCYLVQNKHTKKGPRQKVKRYLGRIYQLEKKHELVFLPPEAKDPSSLLLALIAWELQQHDFRMKNRLLTNKKLSFYPQRLQPFYNKKPAVFALNEGFLCSFTIGRLLHFRKTSDLQKDSLNLAKYFIEAGLKPSREFFVQYYQKC